MSEEQVDVFLQDRHSPKSAGPRDTQFQNFAKDLWENIIQIGIDGYHGDLEAMEGGYELLITRKMHDFALYVLSEVGSKEKLTNVPDLTES